MAIEKTVARMSVTIAVLLTLYLFGGAQAFAQDPCDTLLAANQLVLTINATVSGNGELAGSGYTEADTLNEVDNLTATFKPGFNNIFGTAAVTGTVNTNYSRYFDYPNTPPSLFESFIYQGAISGGGTLVIGPNPQGQCTFQFYSPNFYLTFPFSETCPNCTSLYDSGVGYINVAGFTGWRYAYGVSLWSSDPVQPEHRCMITGYQKSVLELRPKAGGI